MISFSHKPVMLEECMRGLNLHDGGVYFDGTVGGGGHSREILRRTAPGGRLIATDLDDDAIAAAERNLAGFAGRYRIHKSNFKGYASVLEEEGVDELDGVLLDFGVSSFQLDEASRGFSYMQDAPLDMRMDAGAALTAADVVNGYSREQLFRILRDYGEERFANRIAENIVRVRADHKIERTGELAQIAEESIPAKFRHNGPCARKTFQAIRIEVNDELGGLEEAVKGLCRRLKKGGRITPAAAAIGSLLRIKPVLEIDGGKLDAFAKVRTMSQAKETMLNAADAALKGRLGDPEGTDSRIYIVHSKNQEAAEEFLLEAKAKWPKSEFYVEELALAIACHTGPGALAIAVERKLREAEN